MNPSLTRQAFANRFPAPSKLELSIRLIRPDAESLRPIDYAGVLKRVTGRAFAQSDIDPADFRVSRTRSRKYCRIRLTGKAFAHARCGTAATSEITLGRAIRNDGKLTEGLRQETCNW